jgi:hypothetical protein
MELHCVFRVVDGVQLTSGPWSHTPREPLDAVLAADACVHLGHGVQPRRGNPLGTLHAPAVLTVVQPKEDGTYAGTTHLEAGDRPFTGTMVESRDRVRYHGTHGDGTVVATPRTALPALLHFAPDGGGSGGSFTRVE